MNFHADTFPERNQCIWAVYPHPTLHVLPALLPTLETCGHCPNYYRPPFLNPVEVIDCNFGVVLKSSCIQKPT
jgi:hypothetical protein